MVLHFIQTANTGTAFWDYPKGAIWRDSYYFTYNRFLPSAPPDPLDFFDTTGEAGILIIRRSDALAGTFTFATTQLFILNVPQTFVLAADVDGLTQPPIGAPEVILGRHPTNNDELRLWKLTVDWVTPANSVLVGPTPITVATITSLCDTCVPQPDTAQQLDAFRSHLLYRLPYRNFGTHDSLVVASGQRNGAAGVGFIRWYELRRLTDANNPPLVHQDADWPAVGSLTPDVWRWLPTMAMDGVGNIALAYSLSGTTVFPSLALTGRLASDAVNTMTQGETRLAQGSGSLINTNRWGDYASIYPDPVDDCTLW